MFDTFARISLDCLIPDSSVENIIAEESAAFFEGQKSAKDVAGVIQSRVQIYINENS